MNLTLRQAGLQQVGQACREVRMARARRGWAGPGPRGECGGWAGELRTEGCVGQMVATQSQVGEGLVHLDSGRSWCTALCSPGEAGSSVGSWIGG